MSVDERMRDDGMDNDYLWDRSGPVDPEIVRLERLLGAHAHVDAPRRVRSAIRAQPASGSHRRRWRAAFAAAAVIAVCAIGTRAWFQQRLQWDAGQPWQVTAQRGDVRIDGRKLNAASVLALDGTLETGPGTLIRLRAAGIGEIAIGEGSRLQWDAGQPWQVTAQRGDVRIDGRKVDAASVLALDGTLETGAGTVTRLRAAGIGEIAIGEGSRLRLVETRTGRHRVHLQQGSLWARVWAPPGQFGVGFAGAEVIDLGCEFLLQVDADGNGSLSVLSGWVQVDNLRREVLVPQGTRVRVNGDGAAGTPHAFSATPAFVAALEAIDARNGDVDPHGDEIRRLLGASRPQDAISLLALLRDHPHLAEGPMFERLAALLPTPVATRDAWSANRMAVLNAWWDALPYPRVKRWWTQWPDALPSRNGKMAQWLQGQGNG